ncbi:M56 family metallopeptidase [Solitalea koreensis]|uniref:BlaR1 peptidase M56 n=1 Tax=Solitalea koreensis TaxID=543615 RepID=A0A521C509_9SPHI|nr:M56 family metallopeptidase [Solitalea koreensis]SMO53770.1 BlaR1 peptidase M56 [Solitalea koreensis]
MEWLTYLLKASACSALFFGFYYLFLNKLTFFKTNRFYLLFSLLLSFLIPALNFNVERVRADVQVIEQSISYNDSNPVEIQQDLAVSAPVSEPLFNWQDALLYMYVAIALALFIKLMWQLSQLVHQTRKEAVAVNGLKVVYKIKGFTNCSFFNYVFVDRENLTEQEMKVLLKHELVHAEQYHSLDRLVIMLGKLLIWFNPVIYLYDNALEQVHEYEADEITTRDCNTQYYANLLLKLVVPDPSIAFTHNFVKSPLKDRIQMLFTNPSKNMKKLMYLFTLPLALALVWVFAVQIVYAYPNKSKISENKANNDTVLQSKIKGTVVSFEEYSLNEIMNLKSGDKVYPIDVMGKKIRSKVKVGDNLSISYSSKMSSNHTRISPSGEKAVIIGPIVYIPDEIVSTNNETIYKRVVEKYAFGYEVNRARFTHSKIKSIQRNAQGYIDKLVLNDGEFTLTFDLKGQQLRNDKFQKGDAVLVKFIGEKLVAPKSYSTTKLIVLYSQPRENEIRNNTLYDKFYDENGKQKPLQMQFFTKTSYVGKDGKEYEKVTINTGKQKISLDHLKGTKTRYFLNNKEVIEQKIANLNKETISAINRLGTDKIGNDDIIRIQSVNVIKFSPPIIKSNMVLEYYLLPEAITIDVLTDIKNKFSEKGYTINFEQITVDGVIKSLGITLEGPVNSQTERYDINQLKTEKCAIALLVYKDTKQAVVTKVKRDKVIPPPPPMPPEKKNN